MGRNYKVSRTICGSSVYLGTSFDEKLDYLLLAGLHWLDIEALRNEEFDQYYQNFHVDSS